MINPACVLQFDADTLYLRGRLDFESVVNVEAEGRTWLISEAPPHCQIDLGGLDYSNSAGIALLLSWHRVAACHQRELAVVNIPGHLSAIIELVGLEEVLR